MDQPDSIWGDRVKIMVINMRGAVVRRALIEAQLDVPGMPPWQFVDAIDGRKIGAADLSALHDAQRAKARHGRAMEPAEIGCALSHLQALRTIADEGPDFAVILEDDALISHHFSGVLTALIATLKPDEEQLILLNKTNWHHSAGDRLTSWHTLNRVHDALCAHAYVVTRAAARKLVAVLTPVHTFADDWRTIGRSVNIRTVAPYCVGVAPIGRYFHRGNESSVSEAARTPPPIKQRPLRKWLIQEVFYRLRGLRRQVETW